MTAQLWIANAWSWALQVCLLVGVAGVALGLMRVADPRLRLRVWHGVLLVALLLPLLQPWYVVPVEPGVAAGSTVATGGFSWAPWIAGAVVAGIILRAIWLAIGLLKLRRLRRASEAWRPMPLWYREVSRAVGASADIGISRDLDSAVTFGLRHPAVLVPEALRLAPDAHQRAVVAHELTHVARRDWLWVLAEEGVRTALWCHPAVWFALGEAQLAREEVVDRRAIEVTGNRRGYLEALVAAAQPAPAAALGFGPQFYRRRQLTTRIHRLLKERAMSTRRLIVAAGVLALAVPVTVLAGGAAFPLVTTDTAVQQVPPPPPPPPPPPALVPPKPPTAAKAEPPPPPPPPPAKVKSVEPAKVVKPDGPPPPPVPRKMKRTDVAEYPAPPKPPMVIKKDGYPPPPAPVPPKPPTAAKADAPAVMEFKAIPPPPPPAPPKPYSKVIKKGPGGDDVPPPPPPPPAPPTKKGRGGK